MDKVRLSLEKELQEKKPGRVGFCPKCGIYTNHLFLRLDDKLGKQVVGYSCSVCNSTTAAIERNKFTGDITRQYIAPGFKP